MAAKGKKGSKYAHELERLKELNAINEVLKKSDIENAALTNTSKDSETVNDNVIDNMLDQLNINKNATKDLEIVESLASSVKSDKKIPKSNSYPSNSQKKKTGRKIQASRPKPKLKASKAKKKKR